MLKRLTLTSNNLTQLPSQIYKLINLTALLVSSNKLSSLPDKLYTMVNLKELRLQRNQLKRLPGELCFLLQGTIQFDFSDNPLEAGLLQAAQHKSRHHLMFILKEQLSQSTGVRCCYEFNTVQIKV